MLQPRLSLGVEDLKQENNELRANFDEVSDAWECLLQEAFEGC